MIERGTGLAPVGVAGAIAAVHGVPAASITPVESPGEVNHVFVVRGAGETRGGHVVRFLVDPREDDVVDAEAWALQQASAHGIPGPTTVATGHLQGLPYLVSVFVEGAAGTSRPSLGLWSALGRYARTVSTIPVPTDAPAALFSRFGTDLAAAWRDHLAYNLDALTADDPLVGLGAYPAERRQDLRAMVTRLRDADLAVGLTHGDLKLENLLVPEHGPPVLLDWGSVTTGPSPWSDLTALWSKHRTLGTPTEPELRAAVDGCGFSLDDVAGLLDDLHVLHRLDVARWAADRRPDRVPEMVTACRHALRVDP